jgi:hypothetical protein
MVRCYVLYHSGFGHRTNRRRGGSPIGRLLEWITIIPNYTVFVEVNAMGDVLNFLINGENLIY